MTLYILHLLANYSSSSNLPTNKDGLSKLNALPDEEQILVLLPVDNEGQTCPEDGEGVQETGVRSHHCTFVIVVPYQLFLDASRSEGNKKNKTKGILV